MEAVTASFGKLRRGDSFRGAMGITIIDNPKLTELRDRLKYRMKEYHDLEIKSGRFPHVSLFYVDEDEERDRLERHISYSKIVRKTQRGVALTCHRADGTVVEMTGFIGEEVWLVDCNSSDANEWRVMEKRLVTRGSTSAIVREETAAYLGQTGQIPATPAIPAQSQREQRSDRKQDQCEPSQVQPPAAPSIHAGLTSTALMRSSIPLVSRRRAYSIEFSAGVPEYPQTIAATNPIMTSDKSQLRPSSLERLAHSPHGELPTSNPAQIPATVTPRHPSLPHTSTESSAVTYETNRSHHDKRHSLHDLKPKAPVIEAQLEADSICLMCKQRVKRKNYQFCSPRCTSMAAQRAPELIPVPKGHVMYNDGTSLRKIYCMILSHFYHNAVKRSFVENWKTGEPKPTITAIYLITWTVSMRESFEAYR